MNERPETVFRPGRLLLVALVVVLTSAGGVQALEIGAGPGWFLPYGDWSNGFSSGAALHAEVLYPFSRDLFIGGAFGMVSLDAEAGHASIDFLMSAAVLEYRIRSAPVPFLPHLLAEGGMARETLEVGTGQNSDFDVFVRLGGGVLLPVGDRISLGMDVTHLWFLAADGGRGITVAPSVRAMF